MLPIRSLKNKLGCTEKESYVNTGIIQHGNQSILLYAEQHVSADDAVVKAKAAAGVDMKDAMVEGAASSLCWYTVLQRGTRDTPNSVGAERQRAEAKHKQTQATQDTLTRDRPQTHPHKSAKVTGKQETTDNLRPPCW
jgi:hypothetical protein